MAFDILLSYMAISMANNKVLKQNQVLTKQKKRNTSLLLTIRNTSLLLTIFPEIVYFPRLG